MNSRLVEQLEKKLQYHFSDSTFLEKALTHSSSARKLDSNERLEFLGDSILGFVIVEYLFLYKNKFSESVMSKTKSYLVQESVLSEIAHSLSLGRYLMLGKGEEATGGRRKSSLLADAVEAVLMGLKAEDATTRLEVAVALRRIGLGDKKALGGLHELLGDGNARVRRAAVEGVARIGDKEDLPRIQAMADDPAADVRAAVARTIEALQSRESESEQ